MKKANKEFVEKNKGKDRIRGRPIKLNKQKLECKKGKDYAELIFFSDLHWGHPQCQEEKAKAMLDYALKNKIYVFFLGDMIECGLTGSIGDSVYMQKLNPQKQMEDVVDLLQPLADKGLIIGYLQGNHEQRITNSTSIDIAKIMAKQLNVPYLGYAGWSVLSVGGMRYSLYTTHGSGGSQFIYTKLSKVINLSNWITADIVAFAHVHSIASEVITRQSYNRTLNKIEEIKQYVCLTGSYIAWNDTYAEAKGYPPTQLGSPKAKLFSNKKDVHFSL